MFKAFEGMPIKVRLTIDATIIASVIGTGVTMVYKAGELSAQIRADHTQTVKVAEQIKIMQPEMASIAQSNQDIKDQQKEMNEYLRQLLTQERKP